MSTFTVEVCTVDQVDVHPNADRLALATIKGWQCVVGKEQFKAGDLCVYIPIDSILPSEVESKIFGADSKVKLSKSRVKTIKLRGAISQGLAVSFETLNLKSKKVGTGLASDLGITKYEPPVKSSPQGAASTTSKKQSNPYFHKYTGLENFKNYPNVFAEGEMVSITEKIHGTNFRCGWVPFYADTLFKKFKKLVGWAPKWEFVYGSHNVQLQNKLIHKGYYDTNVYAEAVNKYNLKELLKPGQVVYGEVYGGNIQKNYHYGCAEGERKLVLFDVKIDDVWMGRDDFVKFCAM